MFSVKFNIPILNELYIEDFLFEIDIYKNLRAKIIVNSTNFDYDEIVSVMKQYDMLPIILNGVASFPVTPGYASINEGDNLEVQLFGHVANLFKKYGYYTENGNGLIDYTVENEEENTIGISPIVLALDVLKGTNFNLQYAPSVDSNNNINPNNRIYIRGEWLSRAEWMYEIAKNCYFYEYVGPEINVNGMTYMPDFTTDTNVRESTDTVSENAGALIDCCNVMYDDVGNIIIGVAGCKYLGNNLWKKITTNITDFILSPRDTTFNFIEYENAVVQGSEIDDNKLKRTYLAHPIQLDMNEMFKTTFNVKNYTFEGLTSGDPWTLLNDGINPYLQCDTFRTGECNYINYDFATIVGLITHFGDSNMFQIDIADMSGGWGPWPAQEADRLYLGYQTRRAGIFCHLQYPYYENNTTAEPREKDLMEGYYFFLQQDIRPTTINGTEFVGQTYELYLCVYSRLNMIDEKDDLKDYQSYNADEVAENDYIIMRERVTLNQEFMHIPHTIKLVVTPVMENNLIQSIDFTASIWETSTPNVVQTKTATVYSTNWKQDKWESGKAGLFTWTRAVNEGYIEGDPEAIEYPFKVKFDNFIVHCLSDTLYGNVNKPIIMHRDKAINNNTQGVLVSQAMLGQQARDKDIKVQVDPLIFFDRGIIPGQWVQIDRPFALKGEHRVCSINITPDEVELCLNHSDMKYVDQIDGVKKLIDTLDSF